MKVKDPSRYGLIKFHSMTKTTANTDRFPAQVF